MLNVTAKVSPCGTYVGQNCFGRGTEEVLFFFLEHCSFSLLATFHQ